MPPRASEFEEKEFEAPLYGQLEGSLPNIWAPGQVFEEYLGIDRALFLTEPSLWRFFGVNRPPLGVFLHRMDWEFIWRRRSRRRMPNFRLNLFIQAKRSHYYNRRPKHLSSDMSAGRCWRFNLEAHQQQALELVAARAGDRAIVCYAAPVFHRAFELYAHTTRGTILENTTFPLATTLQRHSAWYYREPGASGVANPRPESIKGEGLLHVLRSIRVEALPGSDGTASEQLGILSRIIDGTLAQEVPDDNPRKAIYVDLIRQIDPVMKRYEGSGESERSFFRIAAFAVAFNLDWYAIG